MLRVEVIYAWPVNKPADRERPRSILREGACRCMASEHGPNGVDCKQRGHCAGVGETWKPLRHGVSAKHSHDVCASGALLGQ